MEERDIETQEEQAAAAEAGRIGGPAPDVEGDEASRPVEEAGGGVAEGFEESERELEEQASHGEERWDPEADAFPPEGEAGEANRTYAEPDEVDPTEVVTESEGGRGGPGAGPRHSGRPLASAPGTSSADGPGQGRRR